MGGPNWFGRHSGHPWRGRFSAADLPGPRPTDIRIPGVACLTAFSSASWNPS